MNKANPTPREILQFLDSLLEQMLLRPQMYASNPEAFEDCVRLIDRLRFFVQGADAPPFSSFGYTAFLRAQGFGAASYCSRQWPRALSQEDLSRFQQIAGFAEKYLASEMSKMPAAEDPQ